MCPSLQHTQMYVHVSRKLYNQFLHQTFLLSLQLSQKNLQDCHKKNFSILIYHSGHILSYYIDFFQILKSN